MYSQNSRSGGSVEDEARREAGAGGVEGNKGLGGCAADTGLNVGGTSGAVAGRWTELLKSAVHVDVCKAFEREGVERGERESQEGNDEEQGGRHSANKWSCCGEFLSRVAMRLQRAVDEAGR